MLSMAISKGDSDLDRCEFISTLSSSSNISVEDYILNYFNEIMLLYNLFGDCDSVISIDGGAISPFNILFNSSEDAIKMHNYINGMPLRIYDTKYIVNSIVSDKSIKVSLDAGMV